MITWLMENMATIIISAVLVLVVAAAVASMVRGKRKGKSSCGCGQPVRHEWRLPSGKAGKSAKIRSAPVLTRR